MSDNNARFNAWAHEYSTDLYRYGLWLCKDPTLANDLVQETFLRAWRAMDKLRDEKAVKGWLVTILRREFARTFERKVPDIRTLDGLEIPDSPDETPDERTELGQIREEMLSLDPKYREPLVLQVIVGLSCEEIATELGISKSAVMTQLFSARQKLKTALDPESGGDDGKVHRLA